LVIALAGRRVDAATAEVARFPLPNVGIVERRLGELLEREGATALVSSAACGADLVALALAGRRGVRRRIILPFDRDRFRTTSVIDRPGDWGPVYDRVVTEIEAAGDVVTLDGHGDDMEAYLAANETILYEAAALAQGASGPAIAVLVWEGAPRGNDDVTAAFGTRARERGWRVEQVLTR